MRNEVVAHVALSVAYFVCQCGEIIHKNNDGSSARCPICNCTTDLTICWWVLHSDKGKLEEWGVKSPRDYVKYRDALLEKCKSCENRFICHTSYPPELNANANI